MLPKAVKGMYKKTGPATSRPLQTGVPSLGNVSPRLFEGKGAHCGAEAVDYIER